MPVLLGGPVAIPQVLPVLRGPGPITVAGKLEDER